MKSSLNAGTAKKASIARVREVKKEIDAVKQEMEGAERSYDLNKLAELKYGRLPALEKELAEVEANNKMIRECAAERRSR